MRGFDIERSGPEIHWSLWEDLEEEYRERGGHDPEYRQWLKDGEHFSTWFDPRLNPAAMDRHAFVDDQDLDRVRDAGNPFAAVEQWRAERGEGDRG